jgi:hypothetical protein
MPRAPILAPRGLVPTRSHAPIEADGDPMAALAADVSELRNDVQHVVNEVSTLRSEVSTSGRDRREDILDLRNDIADLRDDMARAAKQAQAQEAATAYLNKSKETPLEEAARWLIAMPVWTLRFIVSIGILLVALINKPLAEWMQTHLRF